MEDLVEIGLKIFVGEFNIEITKVVGWNQGMRIMYYPIDLIFIYNIYIKLFLYLLIYLEEPSSRQHDNLWPEIEIWAEKKLKFYF